MRRFLIAVILAGAATPAIAQSGLEGRVGKLESEMRAVQRKVFPGGAGAYIEPQVRAAQPAPEEIGAPASSAVYDLTQRVSSLESQIASMTGQIEQTQYRMRQLEDQFAAYKKATDARLSSGAAAPFASDGASDSGPVVPPPPRAGAAAPIKTPPATGAASGGRAAQVAAIAKPASGQADEDEYLYGYRLWAAKLYPEAAEQLKKVVATYPRSRRASFAQNLLGRSYLDDGKPSLASIAFYDNYKKMPDGERAPESLYYLGQSLMKLNKPADACKVYGELLEVYGDKVGQGMKDDVARARTSAKCK
ncbi:tetratricopeptide repeat protein [Sphingomonas mucosissima]|uniref:Tol-pal system protein YbgF n=1 Tax=Sphingomonas mucosissima TaxID=370959 RepID=A0A245ZQ32_9SPHN|nr:tetratricopeptide repeat protein [Sphingomonas mucosissima]OWK31854.1 tol-pal system protein YbgF [Sphingomonas mucosissima]